MRAVAYRRIAMAIRMASKVGVLFIIVVLYVTPAAAGAIHSGYLPNGKYPVASTKALNLLHWEMHSALQQLMWLSGRPMLLVAEVRGSIPAKHQGWSRR